MRNVRVPLRVAVPLIFAVIYLALSYAAHSSAYFPSKYPDGPWDAQAQLGASDVWLNTADGVRIHAWWMPREGARLVTLHLHGNAGNISHRYPRYRAIHEAGSAVLALDYRGYGKSQGAPSEAGLYRDADAAFGHLLKAGYSPSQIVVYGESLGTAVAVDVASRRPSAGVVLEAPFTSARDVARSMLPVLGPLLMWGFDSRSKIAKVHAPLLVMHGDLDEVIPLRLGQDLFSAAHEPKTMWIVHGAGHNNVAEVAGTAYRDHLAAFDASLLR